MTVQTPESGSTVPDRTAPGWSDPWTSPLWGDAQTVGGYQRAGAPPVMAPPPAPPAPPASPSRRGLVVVATVAALAVLLAGMWFVGPFRGDDTEAVAAPQPSSSQQAPDPTPQAQPSQPSAPGPSDPGQQPAPDPAPNRGLPPSGALPGDTTLTPEQQADADAVIPGLVEINTTLARMGERGAGTGIVLSADGLVLTNHHVVSGATAIQVTHIGNGQTYAATVLGYDATKDVALLQLEDASGLTVAPLGDSSTVQVGDDVVAIGNAGGLGGDPRAVAGPVTALDQEISATNQATGEEQRLTGLIEFDAPVVPGDSGGAVVDSEGTVVGMITAAGYGGGALDFGASTRGYAIPLADAQAIVDQIQTGTSSGTVHVGETAFLGVQIATSGLGDQGLTVAGVVPDSAAEDAGIATGDTLTSLDGTEVSSMAELQSVLAEHQPGDTVQVTWTDAQGDDRSASVTLGSGPVR